MPKQHVLFGRLMPRMPPRRVAFLLCSIAMFAVFTLIFTLPSAVPTGPSLSKFADHKFSIPKLKSGFGSSVFNPFKQAAHPPPRTDNDTYGDVSWFADWKWLSIPFSSSITLDENRSLLPPLRDRRPIYCYYDNTVDRDKETKDAESDLLLTWRRAWWAQGFKPIILSSAEAMNNPLYDELQRKDVDASLKIDVMRWLAWENMGGGLLAHHLAFPMAAHESPLLAYLRRGEYPKLTRWKGLDNGLFAGTKAEITATIKLVLSSPQLGTVQDLISALPSDNLADDPFQVDDVADAIAFYDAKVIEKKYSKVGTQITGDRATGLKSLNQLVNSHLHTTWQNVFTEGIAVLKPLPAHTSKMVDGAFQLAQLLTHCGESPIQSSCPPNLPKCNQCVASHEMKVTTPARYRNASRLYTIGTVPHPYTMATLNALRDKLDVPWIRRVSERDPWLTAVTRDISGATVAAGPRVLRFKEAVAGDHAAGHSLWLAAEESPGPDDIDWHLGFAVPRGAGALADGRSETPVPGPERRPQPQHDPADGPLPLPEELAREPALLDKARHAVVGIGRLATSSRDRGLRRVRDAVESWNLADTEAWRFARGFLARERVERLKWEEEEARYADGAGSEKGRRSGWGGWLDGD